MSGAGRRGETIVFGGFWNIPKVCFSLGVLNEFWVGKPWVIYLGHLKEPNRVSHEAFNWNQP
jgi:hypothetical protein